LPFENVRAERLLDVVPAETLMLVRLVATLPTTLPLLLENEIPKLFPKLRVWKALLPPAAENAWLLWLVSAL
jgi:hypothetical protein